MKKRFFSSLIFLLFFSALASGQGAFIPPQTALKNINGILMPISNATITVCAGNAAGIPCNPPLVNTIFLDAGLTMPLSNPFTADANGNYQFAAAPGTFTVTVTAAGFAGFSYQVTTSSGSGSNLLPLNNTWTGSNTFNASVSMLGAFSANGAANFTGTLEGITVLGAQGGGGGSGYLMFGTGSWTQNTIPRFDSAGDVVNSFSTDSGAIYAYSGVNGMQATQYGTVGSGVGFVGIAQATLPSSCNGGTNTWYADSATGLFAICTNIGGTSFFNYVAGAGPFSPTLTAQVANIGATVIQPAAAAGTYWTLKVNLRQSGTCTGTPGSVVVAAAFTDDVGLETPNIVTLTLATSGTATASGSYNIHVGSSPANISYKTTWTGCTGGTGAYNIDAWLVRDK
jgi:hypothetical protein